MGAVHRAPTNDFGAKLRYIFTKSKCYFVDTLRVIALTNFIRSIENIALVFRLSRAELCIHYGK
jgi:hypothetical protein